MTLATIHKYKQTGEYTESYQKTHIKYAFIKQIGENEFQELFAPVQCRDYLHDVLHSVHWQVPVDVYGFQFNGAETPIDTDALKLLIETSNRTKVARIFQSLIRPIEKANGFKHTKINGCSSHTDTLAVIADPRWQQNTVMIDLYSLIWRLAASQQDFGTGTWAEVEQVVRKGGLPVFGSDCRFFPPTLFGVKESLSKLTTIASWTIPPCGYGHHTDSYKVHNGNGLMANFFSKIIHDAKSYSGQWQNPIQEHLFNLLYKDK